MAIFKDRYTNAGLLKLFLVCVFPIHVWAIYRFIVELPELRTNSLIINYLSRGGYTLLYAFLESLVPFLFLILISFLLPSQWKESKRLSLLSAIYLSIALWAAVNQIYFISIKGGAGWTTWLLGVLAEYAFLRPLAVVVLGLLILSSVLLPILWIYKHKISEERIMSVVDRVIVLSSLYLALDGLGIIVIFLRNI